MRYAVGGAAAAAVHLGTLAVLVEAVGVPPLAGSVVGFCLAIAVNYTAQYHWVFGSTASHRAAFPRYLAVTLVMLGVNAAVFATVTQLTPLHYVAVQAATTGVVVVLNYIANARFTYRSAPSQAAG